MLEKANINTGLSENACCDKQPSVSATGLSVTGMMILLRRIPGPPGEKVKEATVEGHDGKKEKESRVFVQNLVDTIICSI